LLQQCFFGTKSPAKAMASDDSASSQEDKKQRKKAKKAKKQKKQKKAKRERLTAHAALDLTPAGEPAPAPAPVAETLDDRVRLLAARGASDAEIGKMLREAAGAVAAAPAPINDGFTDAERAARAFSAKVKGDEGAAAALRPLPERRRRRRSRSRSRSRPRPRSSVQKAC